MKEFDLELIKQGHPIQMRDGRKLIFDLQPKTQFIVVNHTKTEVRFGQLTDTGRKMKNGNGTVSNAALT